MVWFFFLNLKMLCTYLYQISTHTIYVGYYIKGDYMFGKNAKSQANSAKAVSNTNAQNASNCGGKCKASGSKSCAAKATANKAMHNTKATNSGSAKGCSTRSASSKASSAKASSSKATNMK